MDKKLHAYLAKTPEMLSRSNLRPLHRFPLIDTQSPDEFRQTLVTRFGALGFDISAETAGFEVTRSYVQLKSVDLVYGACSAAYRVRFPGVPLMKQHFALHNAGRTTFGGSQFNINPNESPVIPAGVEMTHEYQAGFEQFILRVEASALQAKLSAVVGMPIARNIEFARRSNFDNPALRRLRRMLEFMVSELDRDDGKVPAAALVEFEQMLLVAFLTANPHNFSDVLQREQPRPAPWQVRIVEEYILANWNRPITVEALAAVAGASTRSVFKAFRDSRNRSPMAFVKSVRLQHARRMLQQPDGATSVVSVAFACGFLNPGHFARDYRLAFGELPSATLGAAKYRRH
jgi:AraC-like DNA-binding protein